MLALILLIELLQLGLHFDCFTPINLVNTALIVETIAHIVCHF